MTMPRYDINEGPHLPEEQSDRITIKWGGSNVFLPNSPDWDEMMTNVEAPYTIGKIRTAVQGHLGVTQRVPAHVFDSTGNQVLNHGEPWGSTGAPDDFQVTGTMTVTFLAPHGGLGALVKAVSRWWNGLSWK
jgi:hypothetical protein